MGFCSESLSFFLFMTNLIFSLIGLALIGMGVYVINDLKPYTDFLQTGEDIKMLHQAGYMLIGVGCFITLVYVIGFVGACTQNPCILYSFATALCLLVVAEIGISISLFMFSGEAKGVIDKFMNESMVIYDKQNDTKHDAVKKGWDKIQQQFECCGFNGFEDWEPILNDTDKKVAPKSCCKEEGHCITDITKEKVYEEGCGMKFEQWLEGHVTLAGGFIIGIAVLQLLSIIIACCFARKRQNTSV